MPSLFSNFTVIGKSGYQKCILLSSCYIVFHLLTAFTMCVLSADSFAMVKMTSFVNMEVVVLDKVLQTDGSVYGFFFILFSDCSRVFKKSVVSVI